MKDIPTEELAAINVEIFEAARRVGCIHVSITGRIWPGGQTTGAAGQAARFVEFSWLRAAVIGDRAVFEERDPKAYSSLLNSYGLGDDPYAEPVSDEAAVEPPNSAEAPATSPKVMLAAEVLSATRQELERQASAAGTSVGEFLDWKFAMPYRR